MTREEERFKHLVQKTFSTESGRELLDELTQRYCSNNFDENPYAMARKCGESDLVLFLASILDEQ